MAKHTKSTQPPEQSEPTLLSVADELYGRPLGEFTPARDARARELKGTPLAAAVKGLRKPSTAAWVLDLLVRLETEQVEQMLAVGEALRAAQAGLDAGQLRALTTQRRQLTAAVTMRARALARERGLRVTDAVAEQIETTLTAAMVDEGAAAALRSGLLVSTLVATGFTPVDAAAAVALPEALGYAAGPAPRELHAVPVAEDDGQSGATAKARAAAERELAEARAAAEEAGAVRDRAHEQLVALQARALQVQAELEDLRRRIADLEETAQQVDDDLVDAEDDHDRASEDADRAEARVRAADAALDDLP